LEEKKRIANKKEKLAVYTAIIGDYDDLHDPLYVETDFCDYFCFTDNKKLHSDVWKIIPLNEELFPELKELDLVRKARFVKTHPHLFLKGYKHSIWIDANIQINKSILNWIDLFSDNSEILTFIHPERNCIYQEAQECINLKKDEETIIRNQMSQYQEKGYPSENGLVMTNVLYRKQTEQVKIFDQLWWNEIKNKSKRDQLSFNYVAWKRKKDYDICHLHAYKNRFFKYYNHLDK